MAFNERVLAMAARASVPLAERLRYVCIVSSNLDEFFEVRVSDLTEGVPGPAASGLRDSAGACAPARSAAVRALQRHDHAGAGEAEHRDHQPRAAHRRAAAWVRDYLQREVKPLLVPVGLDPSHPFPQVLNKSLNFIVQLDGKDAFGRPSAIAIVKVPRVLPRVIPLPAKLAPGKQASCC